MRAPTALFALLTSASLAASSSPLAAWTYPLGLLKMADMNGPLDSFSKDPGTVMFMPSFHTCGALQILSAPGLGREDLDEVLGREAVKAEWDGSPSKILESAAEDVAVVAWAKGWRKSCGKGGGEVRVAKVVVDGLGEEGVGREKAVEALDTAVATHLAMLPASPAQHLVILTSLSPSSLQTLFDVAGGGSPRPSSPKSPSTDFPERRHRGFLGLVRATFKIFFWMAILVAVPYVGYKLWMERKMRKDRGIMLPLTNDDDLDLEAE